MNKKIEKELIIFELPKLKMNFDDSKYNDKGSFQWNNVEIIKWRTTNERNNESWILRD